MIFLAASKYFFILLIQSFLIVFPHSFSALKNALPIFREKYTILTYKGTLKNAAATTKNRSFPFLWRKQSNLNSREKQELQWLQIYLNCQNALSETRARNQKKRCQRCKNLKHFIYFSDLHNIQLTTPQCGQFIQTFFREK